MANVSRPFGMKGTISRVWQNQATGAELWMGGFPEPGPASLFEGDAVICLAIEGATWNILCPETTRPVHLRWPIGDDHMERFMIDHARALASYIATLLGYGKKVLVHCGAGLNRSGLVVARTLIAMGYLPAESIAMVREARTPGKVGLDAALFNKEFEAWLLKEVNWPI